jgi:NADH-quinone oxidoreductase subunit L
MALALIVLAAGSVLAGWAGVPRALGGADRFERFLEPSFRAGGVARGSADVEEESSATATATEGLELGLMAVSIVAAIGGIGIATFFFLMKKRAADEMAERFAGVHRVLANKYYVDEIYDTALIQPIRIVSEEGLWKGVDTGVIDRAVNGVGDIVGGSSEVLRRIQTGSVRVYAASLFLGVVLILGYYLWP